MTAKVNSRQVAGQGAGAAGSGAVRAFGPAPAPKRRPRTLLLAGVLVFCMAACAPVYRNTGYVPSDQELALIVVGKDTRESVAATLGRPSASGLLNDVGWYYVQSRFKQFGALEPKEIEREVVAITFTEAGIVENVERFGLEDGKVVAISRRVTKSNIKQVGLLGQLFSNIGRLRADQILK